MPEQLWDALKWVIIISAIGGWIMLLVHVGYKYFFEEREHEQIPED